MDVLFTGGLNIRSSPFEREPLTLGLMPDIATLPLLQGPHRAFVRAVDDLNPLILPARHYRQ